MEECTHLLIQQEEINRPIQWHPEQYQIIIPRVAENLRHMLDFIEELAFMQTPNRLARLLLCLSDPNAYTQKQLAARLGTVREVVSRALHELEENGAVRCQRRKIDILDRALLERWANPQNHG